MWLAVVALPPLPTNISLLPASCARRAAVAAQRTTSSSGTGLPLRSLAPASCNAVAIAWA
jgi:hypothetical protein